MAIIQCSVINSVTASTKTIDKRVQKREDDTPHLVYAQKNNLTQCILSLPNHILVNGQKNNYVYK